MNICIINHDSQPYKMGGIKKVLSLLIKEWEKECNIYIVSFVPKNTEYHIYGDSRQYIFPESDILSNENISFLSKIIKQHNIDILFHPYTMNNELTRLCVSIKKSENILLISAVHFSITYKDDLIKHSFFNKYRLSYNAKKWITDLLLYFKYHILTKKQVLKEYYNIYKYLIENSDKVVLLSERSITTISEIAQLNKNELKKIVAINNPIMLQAENTTNKKKNKILWCGRLDFGAKRVDRIIEIWKEIAAENKEWELIVMGDGNLKYFRDITKKMHIKNITFTGACDPYDYYKEGAILCMTSSTEGWPMVLMEALSTGCVPIAYDSFTSASEIIKNNLNGILVPPFDKEEYIRKLKGLMNNNKLRERLRVNGIDSIKRYNHKYIARKWLDLFKETSI